MSALFEAEQDPRSRRVLRISGQASVRTERRMQRSYAWRVARKHVLTPGGISNCLAHIGQFAATHRYHSQAAEKGRACVIEVIPTSAEWLEL